MVVRDLLCSEGYYNTYIEKKNARIQQIEEVLHTIIAQRGAHDEGARNGYLFLANHYLDRIIAMYSAGHPLDEISRLFSGVIEMMEKSWNGENYEQMLQVLSIGVMLNIEEEQFSRLTELVRKYELRDGLIEFLIHGQPAEPLRFPTPYVKLMEVIQSDGSEQAEQLRSYLKNDWYDGHADSGWHDTHKHPDPIYSGYWSFESGAVAKILGLEDESLKDVPYYPYNMAHYKD
ncbi:PoNe immunity protein domain-containing protein [Bhargavaea ginsengi]|uniref:PoNi-like cognate immunity protein n=1 Tax=Bhargavaea ginsengi TaxID=426757 RepID=UPI003C784693